MVAVYQALVPLTLEEQRTALAQLSPALRAAIWQHHLRTFSKQNQPTERQRAVIREGVVLAAPALFEKQSDGALSSDAAKRLTDYKHVVLGTFPHEVIYRLYIRLGTAPLEEHQRESVKGDSAAYCDCADWFDCNPIWPSVVCHNSPDIMCTIHRGCGFYATEACNGVC